jgi:hypothetical protein
VAMNMTKQTHHKMWDSIMTNNYQLYQQVNDDLQKTSESSMNLLPIRLLIDSKPPIQRPCRISEGEMCTLVFVKHHSHLTHVRIMQMLACRWVHCYLTGVQSPLRRMRMERCNQNR